MSDVKALPENLKQIEQNPDFKKAYKNNTVDELESKLVDLETDYLSADNKSELVWRLMDAQGYDFSAADDNAGNTDDNVSNTNADTDASQPATNTNPTEVELSDVPLPPLENSENNDYAVGVLADPDTTKAATTDRTGTNADDIAHDYGDNGNGGNMADDNDIGAVAPHEPVKADKSLDTVTVYNKGAFGVFEPASGTLMKARETTVITIKAGVTKDNIVKNIKQFNKTRGQILDIKE